MHPFFKFVFNKKKENTCRLPRNLTQQWQKVIIYTEGCCLKYLLFSCNYLCYTMSKRGLQSPMFVNALTGIQNAEWILYCKHSSTDLEIIMKLQQSRHNGSGDRRDTRVEQSVQKGIKWGLEVKWTIPWQRGKDNLVRKKFSFPQAETVILFYIQRESKHWPWIFLKYLLRINLNLSTRYKTVSLLENIAEKFYLTLNLVVTFIYNNKYMIHEMMLLNRTLLMLKHYILWNILWREWKKSYILGKCRTYKITSKNLNLQYFVFMEYKWFVKICLQCPLYSHPYLCSFPSVFSYKNTYGLISVIFKHTFCCFLSVVSISIQKLRMGKTEERRAQQWTCTYGRVDRQFINLPIVVYKHVSSRISKIQNTNS